MKCALLTLLHTGDFRLEDAALFSFFLKFGISVSPGFIRSPPLENANPTFLIMIELIFLSHSES